jgi:hypothetical protein
LQANRALFNHEQFEVFKTAKSLMHVQDGSEEDEGTADLC